ncbi:MAG TPA: tRNA uridine-5-carboxymethylaminomethyl(34) synthesis GTPase MnmE [Gemmatimonadales bacterium]|nr:tRNA uridine-5-carboxymethylaminomethyl(34) synthesis GTPase MnmE [Gemmatimonadales bacterium]
MLSDPIAALATPPGRSALAVVRLSGTGAFPVAARVVEGFAAEPARTARLARFVASGGTPIDQGLYLTFPGPNSYTGEDLVELSCHGGTWAPLQVLAALYAAGARPAAPGEFTRRAVLNGKLDLLQAEAVADLIESSASAQARSAIHQLEGGLSRRLGTLRERLVELLALLAYEVDFPEEDDRPLGLERIAEVLADASQDVATLLATAPTGERLRDGALVVFAGQPNAGKSSLFNALLGIERALVTEVPGTTRDTIEAATEMEGWPVRLADTAGLWEAPGRLDRMGVEVSRRYLAAADLVLLCVEGGRPLTDEERRILADRPGLVVRTKADLDHAAPVGDLAVSALTGTGLVELRAAVASHLFGAGKGGYADVEPMLTRERHRVALERAGQALEAAAPHLAEGGDAVLASHHVRQAVLALDELVGAVDAEEIFDLIFSRFCVGK